MFDESNKLGIRIRFELENDGNDVFGLQILPHERSFCIQGISYGDEKQPRRWLMRQIEKVTQAILLIQTVDLIQDDNKFEIKLTRTTLTRQGKSRDEIFPSQSGCDPFDDGHVISTGQQLCRNFVKQGALSHAVDEHREERVGRGRNVRRK
jgi:hypothetical protein